MAGTITRQMPTVESVGNMVPKGTGGATGAKVHPVITVSVPIPQNIVTSDGTGNGGFVSWVNPESGTILVTNVTPYFSTTGTGTFDLGISSDGTGSAADILDGATMDLLNYAVRAYRGRTGTQGAATLGMADIWRLGPGGTGTNNSIVGRTTEVASTALGRIYITYFNTGT